jgi:hypothetical protein
MRQEADRDGALQAAPILPDAVGDRGATLLSEVSKYLDLSEVARYIEQMSSEESEDLWLELDSLTSHKVAV